MTDNAKLVGWKGIAAHFRRDERTVMRWAATKGMPVERVAGQGRGSVYGSPDALDAWLGSSLAKTPKLDEVEFELEGQNESVELPIPAARPRHRAWIGIAMIAGVVAFLTIVALAVLGPAGASPPRSTYTDPVAKAAYLKGTYDWNARTPDSLLSATREYSEAIGLDPRVAASYTGLANSYLLLREYGSLPDDQAYSRAEAAANAAIALDPLSPEAHRALAFIAFWWHRDRTSARSEFARALQLKPDDPLTHHWFATALSANGESSAALHEIETARDLDPTSISIVTDVGLLTYLSGDRGTGSALLRERIDRWQTSPCLKGEDPNILPKPW
jgi:tetratricopeptide (TPR) repeat protein